MKAIKMSEVKRPERRPKTKAWDPSKLISTANVKKVQAENAKAEKGKGKK